MSFTTLDFHIADGVAAITLNRPDNANALNATMARELADAALACEDSAVRAVLLTGEGRMFCPGGDLQEMQDHPGTRDALVTQMATDLHTALIRFARLSAPLVVAVNGVAAGAGFSMILSGDYVIAAESAKFVSAYTASGLTPDGGSTFFLAKHVGMLRAKELMFTNRKLTATEAAEWGIVSRVVADDALRTEATAVARGFADGPSLAYGRLKDMLLSAYSAPLEAQLEAETRSIAAMMRSEDAPNALAAFLEKRKPHFDGR